MKLVFEFAELCVAGALAGDKYQVSVFVKGGELLTHAFLEPAAHLVAHHRTSDFFAHRKTHAHAAEFATEHFEDDEPAAKGSAPRIN